MNDQFIKLKNELTRPIVTALMANRIIGFGIMGAAVVQGSLIALGLPGWPCVFRHGLGLPCPGCGLSRAIAALLQGEWDTALAFHAFAPLILAGLILIVWASFLPERQRSWLIYQFERIERRTGLAALVLIGLFAYWLIRLLFFYEAYLNLIMS